MRPCLKMIQILVLFSGLSAGAEESTVGLRSAEGGADKASTAKEAGAAKSVECVKSSRFTDADLAALKKENREFVVYIWSPYMPLSSKGREEIAGLAKELKIPRVVTVLDPSGRICHEKTGPLADPTFDSKELIDARAMNHFPTMVYVRDGKLAAIVPGYDDPIKFKKRIQDLRKRSGK